MTVDGILNRVSDLFGRGTNVRNLGSEYRTK